ncbi:molybdenum cofactor biosynthesis protein MoaE [Acidocella sp.]|uniref:molybdenum cofactor biosynthesis protein MoaE n=1 Tax=Acidocella sp. TaxID=50710 RepID=UPI003CFE1E85
MRFIAVQEQDFDAGALLARLGRTGAGGIASFIGTVRQTPEGTLKALRLEHYPGMTEKALNMLVDEAMARWRLTGCGLVHRVGRLAPGDNIVFVATASAHRAEALAATAYLIDQLKTRAPFWKAEESVTGGTCWVEARLSDGAAAASWASPAQNLPRGTGRL